MRAPASTPRVGSSASSTRGAPSSARANSTFCWLPPESAATLRLRRRRLDAEPLDLRGDERALARARCTKPPLRDSAEREQRHVLAHRRAAASRPRGGGRPGGGRRRRRASRPGGRAAARARRRAPRPRAAPSPASARRNSRWPLPSTPASPTISPGCDAQRRRRESACPLRPLDLEQRRRLGSPSARLSGKTWSTARPMIRRRISPSEMPAGVEACRASRRRAGP